MSSCASLLPLQLREGPIMDDVPLCPLPYTAKWQKSDRFDGELEEAVGEQRAVQGEMLAQEAATPRPAQEAATPPPTPPQDAVRGEMFRRPLVPVVEGYVDGHVRRAMEAAGDVPSMQTAPKVKVRDLPLTGAVMSRLPHYRLLPRLEGRCSCPICQEKAAEYDRLRTGAVQPDVEAASLLRSDERPLRRVQPVHAWRWSQLASCHCAVFHCPVEVRRATASSPATSSCVAMVFSCRGHGLGLQPVTAPSFAARVRSAVAQVANVMLSASLSGSTS